MIINIASHNPVKVESVMELLSEHQVFEEMIFHPISVDSNISEQPLSLQETIQGAKNRAKNSFVNCDLSIGIESGLMQLPTDNETHVDVCICAIYDGSEFYLGQSSAFILPKIVTDLIFNQKLNLAQAMRQAGLTTKDNLGSEEGAIGIFTRGRLSRKGYTKQAILMALVPFENSPIFICQ